MTIIDNIKPYSPILVHKKKPTFKTTLERDRYWATEKVKWIEGVGYIPGSLYHKTQEQKIKNRNTGVIFRPDCRDVDLLVHQQIVESRKSGEALVIIKGRGIGLSAEFGCLANYFMKTMPGTKTLLTSCDKPKIASLFSEKVALTFDQYDEEIKPVEINRNETATTCFLRTEQVYKDAEGNVQTNMSQIICRETSDNIRSASAFSGEGAIFGAYDELFLHKRRKELIRSSASCYVEQGTGKTVGFLLSGGTVEDTLTNAELGELQLLIEEIQKNGRLGSMKARLLFLPAWMGKFMTNGHSDEKKAREWWSKEIESLEKLKDDKSLRAFRMNNPMSLEDIFDLNKGGRFEDDVSDKIKAQHKFIIGQNIPITKCKLVDIGGNINKELDKKGNIEILEEPRPNVEYYLCVDGVATGTEFGSTEGSSVAGIVVKSFDTNGLIYAPVAIYCERPKTVEQSYYSLIALLKYYNKYNLFKSIGAEGNAGTTDHFASFLTKNNLEKYIMSRRDLSGKGNSNTKKSFQYRTIEVKNFQYRAANIFLRKYVSNIRMPSLLEDMMKSVSENADRLDAWLMFFVVNEDYDKVVKKPMERPKQPSWKLGLSPEGKTIWIETK